MSNQMSFKKKLAVFNKTHGRCAYCGIELDPSGDWHTEHVVPRARKGSSSIDNLLPSCRPCNHKKGGHTPDEFAARLGRNGQMLKMLCDYYDHVLPWLVETEIVTADEAAAAQSVTFNLMNEIWELCPRLQFYFERAEVIVPEWEEYKEAQND